MAGRVASAGLLVAAVTALLGAIPATAQGEAESTLELGGLPDGAFEANGTVALVPFTLTYSLEGLVCLGGALTVTVDLGARVPSAANASAIVSPPEMFFTVSQTAAVQGYSGTQEGLLIVHTRSGGRSAHVNATLDAHVAYFSGCGVLNVPGDSDEAEVPVRFIVPAEEVRAEAPSLGPALLALAVASAAAVRRAGSRP